VAASVAAESPIAAWSFTLDLAASFACIARSRLREASGRQTLSASNLKGGTMLGTLAIAGTGYGLIGLLVIILLVVLIVYFARRA
jgi:hypothetical protein